MSGDAQRWRVILAVGGRSFRIKEIVRRAEQIAAPEPLRTGVRHHVSYHAVAQTKPNPGQHCLLFATARGRRRLFRPGDPRHPSRRGREVPRMDQLPPAYRSLIDWYRTVYTSARGSDNRQFCKPAPHSRRFRTLTGARRKLRLVAV